MAVYAVISPEIVQFRSVALILNMFGQKMAFDKIKPILVVSSLYLICTIGGFFRALASFPLEPIIWQDRFVRSLIQNARSLPNHTAIIHLQWLSGKPSAALGSIKRIISSSTPKGPILQSPNTQDLSFWARSCQISTE